MKKRSTLMFLALLTVCVFIVALNNPVVGMADSGTSPGNGGGDAHLEICDPTNPNDPYHNFSTVTMPATCTTGSITILRCTSCGLEKDPVVNNDALGHLWDQTHIEVISAGDCQTPGSERMTCLRCGATKTIPIEGSHNWTEWRVISKETCVSNGLYKRYCTICSQVDTKNVPATGEHVFNYEVLSAGDCQTPGSARKTCLVCGATETVAIAGAHNWSEWELMSRASCVTNGANQRHCTICDTVDIKIIPPTGKHIFNLANAQVVRRASCTRDGSLEATCTLCGELFRYENDATANRNGTIVLKIRKRGHDWGYSEIGIQPTCLRDGLIIRRCRHTMETELYEACDMIDDEEVIDRYEMAFNPLTGEETSKYHKLKEVILVKATAQSSGIHYFTCTVCGYTSMQMSYDYTPGTDPTGPEIDCDRSNPDDPNHNFITVVQPANCVNGTITFLKCAKCGLQKDRVEQDDALGYPEHLWDENNVEIISAGDCTAFGSVRKTCLRCGLTRTFSIVGSHNWTEWELESQETCVANGTYKRHCTICELVDTKNVPATGKHIFNLENAQVIQRASCTMNGSYEATCTLCGGLFSYENLGGNDAMATQDGTIALKIPLRKHEWGYTEIVNQTPYGQDAVISCRHTEETELYEACGATEYLTLCDPTNPDAPNHYFMDYIVDPSCTTGTIIIRKCTNCGLEIDRIVQGPGLGHMWDENSVEIVSPGDCQTPGSARKTCLRCGVTRTFAIVGSHNWSEWEVVSRAICVANGASQRHCTICNLVDTKIIPATGKHVFNMADAQVVLRATCAVYGTYEAQCTQCGERFSYRDNGDNDMMATRDGTIALKINKRGHDWGYAEIVRQPTCQQDGLIACACRHTAETELFEACDAAREEVISKDEMVFDARVQEEISKYHRLTRVVQTVATAQSNGICFFRCTVPGCGYRSMEMSYAYTPGTDPAGPEIDCDKSNPDDPNHDFTQVVQPADCVNGTITFLKCAKCGLQKDRVEQDDALGYPDHLWDENNVEIISAGDCTTFGSVRKTCLRCGFTRTVNIAGSHNWTAWEPVRQESCIINGTYKRHCTVCEQVDTKIVPATGKHIFNLENAQVVQRASCTMNGSLGAQCVQCGEWFTYTNLGGNDATATRDGTIALKIPKRMHDIYTVYQTPDQQAVVRICRHAEGTGLYEACDYTEAILVCDPTNPDDMCHVFRSYTIDANCTTGKVTFQKCDFCGMEKDYTVDGYGLGHLPDMSSITVVTPGTCETPGMGRSVCMRCGASVNVPIDAEHAWSEGIVIVRPTCQSDGTAKYVCTLCGAVKQELIPHDEMAYDERVGAVINKYHQLTEIVEVKATYTSYGIHSFRCTICGWMSEQFSYILEPNPDPYAGNVMRLPTSLREIDEEAFAGIAAGTVVIPNGCISIGDRAFANCRSLCYVVVPDSVTTFGVDVFAGSPVRLICSENSNADNYARDNNIPVRRP